MKLAMLRVIAALVLLLAAVPLSSQAEDMFGSSKETRFWKWFEENDDRLYAYEHDPGPLFTQLIHELMKVNEYLSFQVGPINNDGRRDFVLSVDGYLEAFPAVEALHVVAPKLPRWRIVKFRQRTLLDDGTMMAVSNGTNEGAVEFGTVRYIMTSSDSTTSIALFLPGADEMPDQAIGEVAWLILHNVLGEEDYGRHVRHVSVSDVSHEYYAVSRPITALPAEFDAAFKN